MCRAHLYVLLLLGVINGTCGTGILYPRDTPSREKKDLSGVWNFKIAPITNPNIGFDEQWYLGALRNTGDTIAMPVPASYNDITQNRTIKDHIGWAWYDLEFFVPSRWKNNDTRVVLRFGSAHYFTRVWLNGVPVMNHTGGHLPFQGEVTELLKYNSLNRITVAINNILTPTTIPQGSIVYKTDTSKYPPGYFEQIFNFDFFNYAGIHRPVFLYTTPKIFVDDITVVTDLSPDETEGYVHFDITYGGGSTKEVPTCYVTLYDKQKNAVAQTKSLGGTLNITGTDLHLWWPYLMNSDPAYLYNFEVRLASSAGDDYYYLPIGVRTIRWTNSSFLINNKSFYFHGVAKHEDANIIGRGFDYPTVLKDFSLLKWLGANSFRTSHYPYAEELLDRADAEGIVVIDECPAAALDKFDATLLNLHKTIIEELVQRDKNRPAVIMWSIANEPKSSNIAADNYFKQVADKTRSLDSTRPVTLAINAAFDQDRAAKHLDIICINRYFAWYSDTGKLELIYRQMTNEVLKWRNQHGKPVIISEYGADTVAGMHMDPSYVFTEDYQVEFFQNYFSAFDYLREQNQLLGEMIWNFADFMTPQGYTRVVGNKKGIFTRDRQPKASAKALRDRYWLLAEQIEGTLHANGGPNFRSQCMKPLHKSEYSIKQNIPAV